MEPPSMGPNYPASQPLTPMATGPTCHDMHELIIYLSLILESTEIVPNTEATVMSNIFSG
jgi:hypothetical protein